MGTVSGLSNRRAGSKRAWAVGIIVAGAALGGGSVLWTPHPVAQTAPPTPAGVPVTVATASRQDFPIYLTGLGQVQAFNAVLVRARVDGTLMQFAPTEGQEVKQGDLLAVIDPRPYKAALDQASGQAGAGRGQPGQRPAGSRPLHLPGQAGLCLPPAGRYPGCHGQPVHCRAGRRRCGDRERQAQPEFLLHHRADRRPHRPPPGGCRQSGSCNRYRRYRHHHPGPSDLGDVHLAAGCPAAGHRRDGERQTGHPCLFRRQPYQA